jgi:hypothetical protein
METLLLDENGYQVFQERRIESLIQLLVTTYNEQYTLEHSDLRPNLDSGKYQHSLSKEYGLNAFPFHTDGAQRLKPPRWIILQYKGLIDSKSATTVLDTLKLQTEEAYEDFFFNEIYLVSGGKIPFLTSVVNKIQYKTPILRWNSLLMKKVNSKRFRNEIILNQSCDERIEWSIGKTLIIDNWRVLHAREPVEKKDEINRVIHRVNLTPIN